MYYKHALLLGISVLAIATVATRDVASHNSAHVSHQPTASAHDVQAALSNDHPVQVADAGDAVIGSDSWRQWPSLTDF